MPKSSLSSDPPLVFKRQFEPSREQQQLWSEAYDRLLPSRRIATTARAATQGKRKQVNESPVVSGFQEERCA